MVKRKVGDYSNSTSKILKVFFQKNMKYISRGFPTVVENKGGGGGGALQNLMGRMGRGARVSTWAERRGA